MNIPTEAIERIRAGEEVTITVPAWHCYRVWMKDGYASLHDANDEASAREQAIALATNNTEGAAMTWKERRDACTVDCVDQLD